MSLRSTTKKICDLNKQLRNRYEKFNVVGRFGSEVIIDIVLYEGLSFHIKIDYETSIYKQLLGTFISTRDYLYNGLKIKNAHIYLDNPKDIESYLENYRWFHQGYIRNYKKQFPQANQLNSLFETIPLDQKITLFDYWEPYDLVIRMTPILKAGGVSTSIFFRKDGFVDLYFNKGDISSYGSVHLSYLKAKGITLELGIKLLDQFYTEYLKSKKRTYKGVFSL